MVVKDGADERVSKDYSEMEDRELIRRFSDGDARAFEAFYRRYYKSLMRFIMSYCKNKSIAEDIVQETFMKLAGFKVRFGLVRNIKSYLFSMAVNKCRDNLRVRSKDILYNDEDNTNSTEYKERVDDKIDVSIAKALIERLPERQREVILEV